MKHPKKIGLQLEILNMLISYLDAKQPEFDVAGQGKGFASAKDYVKLLRDNLQKKRLHG